MDRLAALCAQVAESGVTTAARLRQQLLAASRPFARVASAIHASSRRQRLQADPTIGTPFEELRQIADALCISPEVLELEIHVCRRARLGQAH